MYMRVWQSAYNQCMHNACRETERRLEILLFVFTNSKIAVGFLTHTDGKSSPGGKRKKGDDREVSS